MAMARKTPFRQVDVKRAVAGFRAAGLPIGHVKITEEGAIIIVPAAVDASANAEAANPLDQWRHRRAREIEGR
jgi:hypothetical protein